MGHKTSPIANRLGIVAGWESNWFAGKVAGQKLIEDEKIRQYIKARIQKGGIARVAIERSMKRVTVTIHTSRPGIIIGRGGGEVDRVKEELKKLTGKDVQINIVEIRRPEIESAIVGETIAKQLEARINYRRALKMAIASGMRMGAEGIKIRVSGRIGGAEMARTEEYKQGRTPLHTWRADIDYSITEAQTIYGKIGIKVWVCKGEVYGKKDLTGAFAGEQKEEKRQPKGRIGADRGADRRERAPRDKK